MNAERLLAHYERIADAPDAIARLRRFILDLAVRGKLVPQDPNDEPASELLKRIASQRKRGSQSIDAETRVDRARCESAIRTCDSCRIAAEARELVELDRPISDIGSCRIT